MYNISVDQYHAKSKSLIIECHDIAEILPNLALNTNQSIN